MIQILKSIHIWHQDIAHYTSLHHAIMQAKDRVKYLVGAWKCVYNGIILALSFRYYYHAFFGSHSHYISYSWYVRCYMVDRGETEWASGFLTRAQQLVGIYPIFHCFHTVH